MDELNHDFQALALEGRAMGEVSKLVSEKWAYFSGKVGAVFHQMCPNLVFQKYVLAFPCCHPHDRNGKLQDFARMLSL